VEHLVAKGATRGAGHVEAPRESKSRLDEIGAQSNAYTSLARTTYFINCVSGRAHEALDILCDWMARPSITREDFEREHGVVQRELEMGRDNADRQMWRAHAANFYRMHPAAVPVIGFLQPLKELTYDDVLAYHRKTYVPQAMVFVIVGDIETQAVLDHLCKALAGWAAGRVDRAVLPEVPQAAGMRRVVQPNETVKDVSTNLSFRTIRLVHEDLYALDVLSYVLTNGESSRLHRIVLRDKKLVTSISSSSWTPAWGAGQFTFQFKAAPDKALAAEAEILAQLERVVAAGVTEDELAKAKRQKVADYVYGQQSVESQAATLASDFLASGDVGFSRRYTERIQAVTAAQVQEAAAKYFTFDAMVITQMVPAGTDAAAAAGGEARTDQTVRFKLDNGLTVILSATESVDLVAMDFAVLGGVLVEDDDTNGMGALMARLSIKGAGERTADEIADFFDRSGGSIGAICGNNTFLWSATMLKADAPEAVEILADVVIRPTYAQSELDILRPRLLAAIKRIDEQWSSQLAQHFRTSFFTNSPYRFNTLGSLDVVEKARRDSIAAHHAKWVKAGSAVLSVFGNFDLPAMREAVEKSFAAMPAGVNEIDLPAPREVRAAEQHVLKTTNQVAAIMIGWPGMVFDETADRDAMLVLDTIISGRQLPRGWLHTELRGNQLVYVVHAYNRVGKAPGAFIAYAATQPDTARRVVDIILANIAKTLEYEFTQAEIDEAVNMILTADLLDKQTMAALSAQAALDELYGVGYDYSKSLSKRLAAITPADLRRVAVKYLSSPPVVTVTTPAPRLLEADSNEEQ